MLSIEDDDFHPRVSFERRRSSFSFPLSPLLIIGGLSSKSLVSYNKIPQERLKLTVLKLDGSSFDIEVTKSATVLDLKQAVEDVFSDLQQKRPVKISWPHVWGNFCLTYDGQKLAIENDKIRYYGIKDGDQLHFIRHRSVNYNLIKKKSKKQAKQERRSLSRSYSYEEKEQNGEEDDNCVDLESADRQHYADNDKDLIGCQEPRMGHFLTGWFSYSRLSTSNARSVGIGSGFCTGIRNFIRLCSDKPYHRRDTWRVD